MYWFRSYFGRGTGEEPLTATLADRCAFLLGKNARQRKEIRDNFRNTYRIRSKLVHGRATKLRNVEGNVTLWAKSILDALIKKQLTSIRNDGPP